MGNRVRLLALIILLLVLIAGCQSPSPAAKVTPVIVGDTIIKVTQVIDGDTIIVEGDYRVRYIGIDTPEVYPEVEAFGMEAWQANRRLIEGKEVRLERDVSETDKYGRLLRYVYVDDVLVNAELVKQGLALTKAYPPDTKYQDYLEEMEAEARNAGRGMWAK